MHLKRFHAATMDEALRLVRQELGPEAVILHTKTVSRGAASALARRQAVEVVAALDDDPARPPGAAGRPGTPPARSVPTEPCSPTLEPAALRQDLDQVKGMLSGLLGLARVPADLPGELGRMYWSLLAQEVDEGVARRWVVSLREELRGRPPAEPASLSTELAGILAKEMPGTGVPQSPGGRRLVALVGPTGVGKTTTIAKLAARCRFQEKRKVALVTTDTYRIAGAQQLETYAALIGLPFRVAPFPADLRRALDAHGEADVIFIDTVGRSPRRRDQMEELKGYVSGHDGCEVQLVLSATTKRADLLEAVEGYRPLAFSSIIATKLDETATVGPLIEASLAAAVPIAYLTTGQEVPDDIEEAHPLRLAGRLAGVS